jgi:hypothetical protein
MTQIGKEEIDTNQKNYIWMMADSLFKLSPKNRISKPNRVNS